MAILKDLIGTIEYKVIQGSMDTEILSIAYDSRKCTLNSLFVCIQGNKQDGHDFIYQAIEQGASAIFVQELVWETKAFDLAHCSNKLLTVVIVQDTRKVLAQISSSFFKNPSGRLKLLGVTGTKGKTTTTYMFREICLCAGKKTGLVGTIANYVGGEIFPSERTTPESYDLQKLLAEMIEKGDDSCVMEVSSNGLMYDRVGDCSFYAGVFTNIYHDHIGEGEHASMEEYYAWKMHFFSLTKNAVINGDIPQTDDVVLKAEEKDNKIYLYGLSDRCDIRASSLVKQNHHGEIGTAFHLTSPWYEGDLFVGMPTVFNVYNALAAIALAGLCGLPFEAVREGLMRVRVPGRLQSVPNDRKITILVDYAHNSASLEQVLQALREYAEGRLITVFGCGGNRSSLRRFEMGEISGKLSDLTTITSDNPRDEERMSIINDIRQGLAPTEGKYIIEEDRRKAIQLSVHEAKPGDIVVIAGKGHEDYQIEQGKVTHFDDAEVIREILDGKKEK